MKKSEEKKELLADLGTFKALDAVLEQEGGKILVKNLEKDFVSQLEIAISLCSEDEMKLRAAVIKMKATLDILRALKRAKKNIKELQEYLMQILLIRYRLKSSEMKYRFFVGMTLHLLPHEFV
jgi:sulfite reductase alpha subunit-like flavoprotein